MKKVTESEFKDFIDNYPTELYHGFVKKAHPPRQEYNDFSIGNYPDSIVAYTNLYHISDSADQPNEYYIKDLI